MLPVPSRLRSGPKCRLVLAVSSTLTTRGPMARWFLCPWRAAAVKLFASRGLLWVSCGRRNSDHSSRRDVRMRARLTASAATCQRAELTETSIGNLRARALYSDSNAR